MSNTLVAVSTAVVGIALAVRRRHRHCVLKPGLLASKRSCKRCRRTIEHVKNQQFHMTLPASRSLPRSTVWAGSGPKTQRPAKVVWPKHSEMVSHPRVAVGTGLKLLFVRAVLMLKNL